MRKMILPFVLALTMLGTSCIGPNNAFRGLGSWNTRATDSKWWNEVIWLGLWIVPAYPLALAGDVVIFNSIEFWGGENPFGEPSSGPTPQNEIGG